MPYSEEKSYANCTDTKGYQVTSNYQPRTKQDAIEEIKLQPFFKAREK